MNIHKYTFKYAPVHARVNMHVYMNTQIHIYICVCVRV